MADYDFPPLLQGEGPSLDAAAILGAQARGEWARTFGEAGAGKNNLMTRKRHNADIARETEVNQQLQEEQVRSKLLTSKAHQDLYFRGRKLEMDEKLGNANLALREQQFNQREAMAEKEIAAKEATTRASLALEKERLEDAQFKADHVEQEVNGNKSFREMIKQSGAKPGTPEYAHAVAAAREANPNMNHGYFQDTWKTQAGSELEPDEALKRVQAYQKQLPGMDITAKLPGGVTARSMPDSSGKDRKTLQDRYDKYLFHRSSSSVDPAQVPVLDKEIAQMKAQLDGSDKPAAAATAPAASAPAKTVWKMKDGVKWEFDSETKKPTGKYIKGQ